MSADTLHRSTIAVSIDPANMIGSRIRGIVVFLRTGTQKELWRIYKFKTEWTIKLCQMRRAGRRRRLVGWGGSIPSHCRLRGLRERRKLSARAEPQPKSIFIGFEGKNACSDRYFDEFHAIGLAAACPVWAGAIPLFLIPSIPHFPS